MAIEVVMPRLGWTMETGTVVEWLRHDGDTIAPGDLIFSVESDKAVTEIEAMDGGVLRIPPDTPVGVEVPVGAPLAYIVAPGEAPPFEGSGVAAAAQAAPSAPAAPAPAQTPAPVQESIQNGRAIDKIAISPRARRLAESLGIDWTIVAGSGSTGRIREADIRAAAGHQQSDAGVRATPMVRRLAEETGVALGAVPATGPAGRVTRADVRGAAAAITSRTTQTLRKVIAQRMTETARTVVPVTLTTETDATELSALRSRLRDEAVIHGQPVPSFTDTIARITALALRDHPELNSSFDGEALTIHPQIDLGIAVDTERGLLVPVIRDADRKSLGDIAIESADLLNRTREGGASRDELRGSTFTISNLGMFGIDAFTPIINLPEAAILGIGRIVAKPVVIDEESEEIAVRRMLTLSLTFDHRAVDGAPAARFLQHVSRMISHPYGPLTR